MGEVITIEAADGIPREVVTDARTRVEAAVAGGHALVEALRLKVAAIGAATTVAQVNAEVDGRKIRVQEAAQGLGEALDRVTDRLRQRIVAVTGAWTPRPWPRPHRPVAAPPAPVGSPLQRIARVKSPSLVWCSPDAAVRTLDAMDYDIHLFTDPATETDAVVYRVGPTGYRLARTVAAAPPRRSAVPLTLCPQNAPRLANAEAVDRLDAAELPFLFYAHPGTGRGRVLYRRFDGHLGLIAGAS